MQNKTERKATSNSLKESEVIRKIIEFEQEGIQVGRLFHCNGLPVVEE